MKGKDLRAIRDKLGWTQAQFSSALEVTPTTYARWERDERAIAKSMAKFIQMIYAEAKKKR